jgi:hypothetical protein
MSSPESTLAVAWPIVLDDAQYARATAHGLAGRLGPLRFEAVIVDGPRFRLAKECEDQRGAEVAFLLPALDAEDEIADVVAWWPETGRTKTLVGEIGTLGLPRLMDTWLEPPMVHETMLEWLLADVDGLFVLDPKIAAAELDGITLAVPDRDAGIRLRAKLAPYCTRAPKIVIPRSNARRAG